HMKHGTFGPQDARVPDGSVRAGNPWIRLKMQQPQLAERALGGFEITPCCVDLHETAQELELHPRISRDVSRVLDRSFVLCEGLPKVPAGGQGLGKLALNAEPRVRWPRSERSAHHYLAARLYIRGGTGEVGYRLSEAPDPARSYTAKPVPVSQVVG